jgi:hypothetical protein
LNYGSDDLKKSQEERVFTVVAGLYVVEVQRKIQVRIWIIKPGKSIKFKFSPINETR